MKTPTTLGLLLPALLAAATPTRMAAEAAPALARRAPPGFPPCAQATDQNIIGSLTPQKLSWHPPPAGQVGVARQEYVYKDAKTGATVYFGQISLVNPPFGVKVESTVQERSTDDPWVFSLVPGGSVYKVPTKCEDGPEKARSKTSTCWVFDVPKDKLKGSPILLYP